MDNKSIFNLSVCLIGALILLIHIVDLLIKKNKRKDEYALLGFLSFTAFHFVVYSIFTLIKANYTSNALIMAFYTVFFIFNNVQLLLFFIYARTYIKLDKKVDQISTYINLITFSIFIILDIVNIFSRTFFTSIDGVYTRTKLMIIAQGYQFIAFIIVFIISIFNKRLKIGEKIAFGTYCFIPLISIIIQNMLPGYAIAYLSLIVAIEIMFLFVNVKKNILIAEEEKANKDAKIRLMMSQIKPHFVYNTLASISTLIDIDPSKAQLALDQFTEYLRNNFSALSDNNLIPFEDELKHIKTYLSLEKMRFNERLNIIYEIEVNDFMVPPLSIQPIVENAVKHGILKKIEGGLIKIKTYKNNNNYVVEINDNGVGFNVGDIDFKSNRHIGLSNVYYRIKNMCNGDMRIESSEDKGSKIIITFKK